MSGRLRLRSTALAICLALLFVPVSVRAQDLDRGVVPAIDLRRPPQDALTPFERRVSVQIGVVQMRPLGELAKNIGFGYGLEGAALVRLDAAGVAALRAEMGFAQYASERMTVGDLLTGGTTTYDVWTGGVGTQLMAPTGWVRPYISGSAGFVSFVTQSEVLTISTSDQPTNPTTEHEDTGFAWLAGGGIYVPIHHGQALISLDFGATYHVPPQKKTYFGTRTGQDSLGATITITHYHTDAKFMTWKIGVRVSAE